MPARTAKHRWLAVIHLLYTAALLAVVLGLYVAGDRTWWGTALLFSPRWIVGTPLLLLIPLAVRYRRRWLWWDAILLGLFLVMIMGLQISVPSLSSAASGSSEFRVVTCNLKGERSSLARLLEIASEADVLMLQECPPDLFSNLPEELRRNWYVEQSDMLAIASRHPLSGPRRLKRSTFGGWGTIAFGCRAESPLGSISCVTLHLETPREGLEALLRSGRGGISKLEKLTARREKESRFISEWIDLEFGPSIVAGDFNMPVESWIYQRFWSHATNAFSEAGLGLGYTKFTRWHGVRIDHILPSGDWQVEDARVLADVGSDHRPVSATLIRRTR